MKKEQRYRFEYEADGKSKVCYPKSEETKNKNLEVCKEKGYKVIKVTKLYPFSTYKNQHNFMLVKNRCSNKMDDMNTGVIPYNKKEYNRLYKLASKAEELYCLELPVAWLDWETMREAKTIAEMAINWRAESCIRNGRFDLLQYCD